jgi:hypothetical protein
MATGVAIQGWALGWTLGLVLGFPLLMLLLGELQLRLERRQQPLAQPLAILRQGSLPLAAAFVLLRQVLQWPAGAIFVRLAETFLWITLIYAALTLLNVLLFERAGSAGWQAKIPQNIAGSGPFRAGVHRICFCIVFGVGRQSWRPAHCPGGGFAGGGPSPAGQSW